MFLLLTIQFRSYAQALLILAIIPFGFIGAIGGHVVMGLQFTLFSIFGIVALSGVVVNDAIVLVDFIDRRRRTGMEMHEALVEAGRRRFRPVLLTSVTTIAGMLPIILEQSRQAMVVVPMAVSLSFGLMLATALVLILGPTLYSLVATEPQAEESDEEDGTDAFRETGERLEPVLTS
jgi:multidrug efflux pump subunit AcrB